MYPPSVLLITILVVQEHQENRGEEFGHVDNRKKIKDYESCFDTNVHESNVVLHMKNK